jgi:MFS family permease/quinol monooxygenase YgiN
LSATIKQPSAPVSLWHPLRTPTFRSLLVADVVSDLGTFMQSVGAAWLMVSLNAGPLYIALTQTASALPFFVFALPAGSIGDIVDRRKLILFTEIWMASVAVILAAVTLAGLMTPPLLLILTFALSAGDAVESPTWRAVLPELVSKEDLASASALNGIEFNFARAVGPALAGFVIAAAGVGSAFAVNAASFFGVIVVIARWKRSPVKRTVPTETLSGATTAAIRYVRYSPPIRTLLVRSGATMFFSSGLLALLPSVARGVSRSPEGYGLLLGCFGAGAVLGALTMRRFQARGSSEIIVSAGVLIFGLSTTFAAFSRNLPALCASMLVAGAAWILFLSLLNVLMLNYAPDWVRARVLAVSMLVVQGAVAGGSASWGALAGRFGIHNALLFAGLGAIATTILGLFFPLPATTVDLTPWAHWRQASLLNQHAADVNSGPIMVTVEYEVAPEQEAEFLKAIHKFERIRRRDGAYEWDIFRDIEKPNRYVETFLVASWGEHLRQHERATHADREVEERVQRFVRGEPVVRHLVHPNVRA